MVITTKKKALEASHRFLFLANQHTEMRPLLEAFVRETKALSMCEAVGIRILDGDGHIPYEAYEGFSSQFYESESPLSIHTDQCMCINVITGDTDPTRPFYTEYGSFFMNSTTDFLATVSQKEKGKTRNMCNRAGFESVALIPICLRDRRLGLIHVADSKEDMVPLEKVKILEHIAMQLGGGIERVWAEEILRKTHTELESLIDRRTADLQRSNQRLTQEIRHHKKTAESLRESEERYRAIFELAANSIVLVDLETQTFEAFNENAHKNLGYSREEFETLNLSDIQVEPPAKTMEEPIDALLEKKRLSFETIHKRKDGTIRNSLVSSRIVTFGGKNYALSVWSDITDRKKAEKARRESEVKYKSLYDNMNEGVCVHEMIYDKHGAAIDYRIIDVNRAFESITGLSKKKAAGSLATELYGTGDPPFLDIYSNVAKTGQPVSFDLYWPPMKKYFSISAFSPKKDIFATVFNDITEQKRAEEALRDAVLQQKEAVKAGNVGIWDWDLKTNKVLYSAEWKRQIGYEEHEIGEGFEEWQSRVHPDDLEKTLKHVKRMVAEKQDNYQVEFRFRHKDGSYRWILAQASVITDENGVPVRTLGSHVDITKHKEAEKTIAVSEERLKLALDSVSEAVWDWRVDTGELYFSSRWYTMLGYEPYEFPEKFESWQRLVHPEDLPRAERVVAQHLENGEPFEIEFRMRTKDNQWKYILGRGKMVEKDASGKAVRMLGTHVDISERKKMEDRLRQAQKMEAIGTLAGGIAHDFNNILTPVMIQTELALLNITEDSPTRNSLQEVLKASHRAKDLVKQILTFSRQTEMERVPLTITPILKEALKLLRATLPSTIQIEENIKNQTGTILADPTEIHQVLMNLCTNAAHAMRERGGRLKVTLCETEIDAGASSQPPSLSPGKYLKLSVSDSGHGIDPAIRKRIFEPFFTTKDRSEGTGMGLSVVHGIVQSHGGAVEVDSELGKGTTFHLFFPKTANKNAEQNKPILPLPTGNEHVLLVDDEKSMIDAVEAMLTYLGYRVTTRTSSIEALEAFRAKPDAFDVVITDMTMPNLRGDKLARKLIEIKRDITIILCTGFSEMISEEKAKDMGIQEFVMKPIELKDMANTLRKALDHR